ncbi:peptide antibiotic transporter SbmA [Ramlibacter ginsenosidimutans]|uniref:Peptide antibiotic transporter SbmA n=1 Tax=Ramlibacter ginsenosidimutans TaxID=502333 RepID=A0A934WNZ1_9BURK|nr:peptide antibiotic transporter SbmA [Ramlibacter ginsenosidimutans]MBK6008075.1 peptide antibiotic transporter SbmA [Ramlibacter ginsenosidimutans]
MFRSFFLSRRWLAWSVLGTALILYATWYRVQLDVRINEWFGTFYDLLQKALDKPGSITAAQYWQQVSTFLSIAMIYVTVAVVVDFFIKHYVFRWRQAMNQYYMANWEKLRVVEGAAQRVQEDTMRFASIVQGLGVDLMRSLMTLAAFLPILWALSEKITSIPILGAIPHSLVWVSLGWAAFGTVVLAFTGILLPGLEFNNQRVEAAYRKELVYGEDDPSRASPPVAQSLFQNVRHNYFRLFFHYLYFDVVKWSYLQASVLVPLVAMGPTVVAGVITLGAYQQIARAFDKVTESFQYLVYSWSTIVELISVYKRLRAFEARIHEPDVAPPDDGLVPLNP